MKTIEQLLELTKNPHYTLRREEQEVLDAFLSQKQESDSDTPQEKTSNESSKKTRAIVRNVVKKTDTYPPVLDESDS